MKMSEGHMTGICLEDPVMFRKFTENLWNQSNGEAGEIYITEGDRSIKLQKEGCVILNPYVIDVNEKKILSHIYEEMQEEMELDYYERGSEINRAIVSLLDDLENRLPYPLEYSLDLDFHQLLKLYGVKVESTSHELLEKIINYIRLAHQVLGVNFFAFVQLRNYFNTEELKKLREMISYEQIYVLMVENIVEIDEQTNQKWWIVDRDSCIIEI
jgi:CRISPR-associated protein Csn2